MEKQEIIHIDDLANVCGFFNSETPVNNHYGCDHSDNEEKELMQKVNGEYDYAFRHNKHSDKWLFVAKILGKRKFSSKRRVKKAVKKYNSTDFDNNNIKKYGLKLQGKCFSFSCPLCYEADEEYCEENGIEYYHDMVVVKVELLKELER